MMVVVVAIFYFFMIRPQQKKQKEIQKSREALKKGDKVITIGGIYGVVTTVGEKKIALEVAPGVILDFSRSAINGFQDATKQELTENA